MILKMYVVIKKVKILRVTSNYMKKINISINVYTSYIVLERDTYSSVYLKKNQLVYTILWKGDCRYLIILRRKFIFF